MSDLISRSELLKEIEKYKFGAISNDAEREYIKNTILDFIIGQPTAYSVDGVVEELEEIEQHCLDMSDWQGQSAMCNAIEIVKQEAEKFGTDINVVSNGWIPCSKRLPEPIRPVLVTLRNWMNDKYFVRVGRFHTDHWKTDEGIVENSIVLAWQPLPEPYKG